MTSIEVLEDAFPGCTITVNEDGLASVDVCVKKLFDFYVNEEDGAEVLNGKKCVEVIVNLKTKPYYCTDADHKHRVFTFEVKGYMVQADEQEIRSLVRSSIYSYCNNFDADFIVDDEQISDITSDILHRVQVIVEKTL